MQFPLLKKENERVLGFMMF